MLLKFSVPSRPLHTKLIILFYSQIIFYNCWNALFNKNLIFKKIHHSNTHITLYLHPSAIAHCSHHIFLIPHKLSVSTITHVSHTPTHHVFEVWISTTLYSSFRKIITFHPTENYCPLLFAMFLKFSVPSRPLHTKLIILFY